MSVLTVCRQRHGQSREHFRAQTRHTLAHVMEMDIQHIDILVMSVAVVTFSESITCQSMKKTHTVCCLITQSRDIIVH